MAELEDVAELDRDRHVREPEIVAHAAVEADGDSDHAGMVTPRTAAG